MYRNSPGRSGARALRLASALALLPVVLAGCLYSFAGGGLPSHVRTVAIAPLENQSRQPLLETDVERALQLEVPRSLGVRLADLERADAVIRGTIRAYEEVAASVRPSQQQETVPVVSREVRITYDLEVYDQTQDKVLWKATSQAVSGSYLPESESVEEGRARAIKQLVNKVVEGAQSQW